MTTNEVARLFDKGKPVAGDGASDDRDTPAQLRRLQETALGLLAGLDRAPKSLRIRTDRVEIDLEWPEQERAAVAPGPAADAAGATRGAAAGVAAPEAARGGADSADGAEDAGGQFLLAQTVGVFYRSPEPGAKPFVEPGDVVSPGQQIGIIEAMKLMIPIEAEEPARIIEVLVADGSQVEYGDRLFAIEPADEAR